jgi:hypothetical protein
MTPAIVVLAYNRPAALKRLLGSVAAAHYPAGASVPLVISIDRSDGAAGRETAAVADGFEWGFGPKSVIERPEHLGVVGHFREAGGLTREYGDVIILEDDLTVAPPFYEFASRVLEAYGDDQRIAGCCLYGLWFNGFTQEPFLALEDGSDVFFLALPYTQGLCFSARQWQAFADWWGSDRSSGQAGLHPAFSRFGADEWFPALAASMAANGRYFCFPRVSLTVGWGDAGAHFAKGTSWFQTPVQVGRREYRLPAFDDAIAVYDGFFEIQPERLRSLTPGLAGFEFDVDLNATKRQADLRFDQVLTTRPVRKASATFGLEAYPQEMNVVWGVPGDEISLAHGDDVRWDDWAAIEARRRLYEYAWRRYRPSRRRSARFVFARLVELLRGRRR